MNASLTKINISLEWGLGIGDWGLGTGELSFSLISLIPRLLSKVEPYPNSTSESSVLWRSQMMLIFCYIFYRIVIHIDCYR
ncbi:MAG: hypothetical protein KME21_27305 [Desmonostoc vinosum HA7617-LM4]|nr:hypothetical protein [Desmonostoc vinosum HA7617-LM4]